MYARAILKTAPPTFENHLRYEFENSNDEFVTEGRVIVHVGACLRKPENLVEEGMRAARLIRESTTSPIWVCLSGGVDSEATARCFKQAGVSFRAAIMRFPDELNLFDIRWAVDYCVQEGIPYDFFDLDILRFYEQKKHLECARLYRCRSPQFAAHIELMKLIPGFPVLSWNIPNVLLSRRPGESLARASLVLPNDHFFCYHRYFEREQREGVAFFFAYTPELLYSGIRLPVVQELLFDAASPRRTRGLTYEMKIQGLRQGGFDVVARENKFTGFEKVKAYYDQTAGIGLGAYETLFRRPMEALSSQPREHVYRLSKKFFRA